MTLITLSQVFSTPWALRATPSWRFLRVHAQPRTPPELPVGRAAITCEIAPHSQSPSLSWLGGPGGRLLTPLGWVLFWGAGVSVGDGGSRTIPQDLRHGANQSSAQREPSSVSPSSPAFSGPPPTRPICKTLGEGSSPPH